MHNLSASPPFPATHPWQSHYTSGAHQTYLLPFSSAQLPLPYIPAALNFIDVPYFLMSGIFHWKFLLPGIQEPKTICIWQLITDCSRHNSKHSSRKPSPKLSNTPLLYVPSALYINKPHLELYRTKYFRKLDKNNCRPVTLLSLHRLTYIV